MGSRVALARRICIELFGLQSLFLNEGMRAVSVSRTRDSKPASADLVSCGCGIESLSRAICGRFLKHQQERDGIEFHAVVWSCQWQ